MMVGKTTHSGLNEMVQEFQQRLKHYVNYETLVVPELRNIKNLSIAEQKEKEADLLLKHLDIKDEVILLDENGKMYTSADFASFIEKKMMKSAKCMVFVVGGPFGFSPRVYQRANGLISLSAMTFSHQMIRLLFTEQLYRAMTILRGESYHHQ
jgi:23S rRNA (pseudouridine1915-N3)-methyltransferase